MKKEKSNSKGCLIGILVLIGVGLFFVIMAIIVGVASDWGDKDQPLVVEPTSVVDSTMIKYNDSLRIVEEKKIQAEKRKFNTQYDDIEKTTWIYSKTKPKYANSLAFYSYIGLADNGKAWKRLVIRYHGEDWLFINKIIIKTDNNTYTVDASDSKRDNNADVWEWIDIAPTAVEDVIINDIVTSKNTKIRFVGRQYNKDWVLSQKEIKGLKEIDEYYCLLNSYYVLNKK